MLFALLPIIFGLWILLSSESPCSHISAILHNHDFLTSFVLSLRDVDCLELLLSKLWDWEWVGSQRFYGLHTANVLPLNCDALCTVGLVVNESALDLLLAENGLVELLLFIHFADILLLQDLCSCVRIVETIRALHNTHRCLSIQALSLLDSSMLQLLLAAWLRLVFVRIDCLIERLQGNAIHNWREAFLGELGCEAQLFSHDLLLLVILSQGSCSGHLLLALLCKKSEMVLRINLCKFLRALCLVDLIPFLLHHLFLLLQAPCFSWLAQLHLLVALTPQLIWPDLGAAQGDAWRRFLVSLVVLLVGDHWLGAQDRSWRYLSWARLASQSSNRWRHSGRVVNRVSNLFDSILSEVIAVVQVHSALKGSVEERFSHLRRTKPTSCHVFMATLQLPAFFGCVNLVNVFLVVLLQEWWFTWSAVKTS